MKKLKSTAFVGLLLILPIISLAQKAPFKFGKVSMEELQMPRYEADTSAAAVVLGDIGFTYFSYNEEKGFQLNFERTKRIKVFKKEGYEHADVSIYLYKDGSSKEKLLGLKAYTYNLENGKIIETKLKDNGIFEEASNENTDITKFTFPNVKEGSVIEFTYKILSDFTFNLQDWTFQSTIPTALSEYRVRIPEYFRYQQHVQGYLALNNVERKTTSEKFLVGAGSSFDAICHETRYLVQEVPAFEIEGHSANPYNYISKINFELAVVAYPNRPTKEYMSSWEALNRTFLEAESFGLQVNGSGYLKDDVNKIIDGATSDEEKIMRVYAFVKNQIEWDGSNRKYASKSFRKLLDERKGSSADINLLLVSMLKKANIKADPILISTQQNGLVVEQFPLSSQFNYVACYVSLADKYLILDGTDRLLPYNILPTKCLNGKGYVISESNIGWKPITITPSSTKVSASLKMDQDGNASGTVTLIKNGYHANQARKKITKSKEDYIADIKKTLGLELSNPTFIALDTINEPLKETYESVWENDDSGADLIYFNPVFYGKLESNPFKLEERTYPVEFEYPSDELFYLNLQLPENYVVDEMPESKIVSLPNNSGKFSYKITYNGNNLVVINQLTITKQLFGYDEYASLKEFFSIMVAKHAEQIVLKKIK